MSDPPENETSFQRYSPQHPLPEKIQQMTRDETVCQYCGVSYLIHTEIKALEKKLAAAEKELEHLRGCEEREKELKNKLEEVERKTEELGKSLEDSKKENDRVVIDLKKSEESCTKLKDENTKLEKVSEGHRLKWTKMAKCLSNLSATLTLQKSSVKQMKMEMKEHDKMRTDELNRVKNQMVEELKTQIEGEQPRQELLSRLGHYEMENTVLKESSRIADVKLRTQAAEMEEMERLKEQQEEECKRLKNEMNQLEKNCQTFESSATSLKNEVEKLRVANRNITMETEQFQNQLKSKSKELDHVTSQLSKKEHQHEVALNNVMVELKAKDAELQSTKKDLKNLENRYQDQVQKQQVINSQTAATVSETRELKEALSRARGDLEALKNEREMMISVHHNRIEELRESFKHRMAETEHWPQKLADALQKERNKHKEEISVLENKLKQDFVAALQVEKEKYDQLMQKYQDQLKNKDSEAKLQLEKQMAALKSSHQVEITALRKQMADSKARATDDDRDFRKEIASLKKIIADLENRIGYLNEGSVDEVNKVKRSLQLAKQELMDVKNELASTQGHLQQTKEEVAFLQETVQKECEERFELTEALSEARKELLQLKMPAGGYSSANSQRGTTLSNSAGSIVSARSRTSVTDDNRQKSVEHVSPANKNVGFHGNSAKPLGNLKGNSVSENRKRIAAILGKQ